MGFYRFLSIIALSSLWLVLSTCGGGGGGGNLSVKLNLTQDADQSLFSPDDRIVVRIYGPDFRERRFEFTRSQGSGRIDGIPEGEDRVIKVDEYDRGGVLLARGFTYGVRIRGEENTIPIEMVPKGWVITLAGGKGPGDSPDGTYAGNALLNGPAEVEFYDNSLIINDLTNRSLKIMDNYFKISNIADIEDISILNKGDNLLEIDLPYPIDFIIDDYVYCLAADMQIYSTDLTFINDIHYTENPGVIFPSQINKMLAGKNGEFFLSDFNDHLIYKVINGNKEIYVQGGDSPITIGEGIDKNSYGLSKPTGIYYDGTKLYFADSGNNKIKYVENDLVFTYIGSYIDNLFFDGIKTAEYNIKNPNFLKGYNGGIIIYELDTGNILIEKNGELYRVTSSSSSPTTILKPLPPDSAGLVNPRDVTVDDDGNLYIADTGNDAIRMVVGGAL